MSRINKIAFITCCLTSCGIICFSQSPASLINKGNQAYAQSQLETARRCYMSAISGDPEKQFLQAYFNLGNVYFELKDYAEAIKQYQSFSDAAKNPPLKSRAFYNMGTCYLAQKNYRQSIDAFQKALILDAKNENARYNLSYIIALLDSGNNTKTLSTAKSDKKKKTNSPPLKPLTREEQARLQKLLSDAELQAMKNTEQSEQGKLERDW